MEKHTKRIDPARDRRRRRGAETRKAILDAARQEFAVKGFAGGSMRSIARSLGLEIAHIQHHFRDKGSLWAEVAREVVGGLSDRLEEIVNTGPADDPALLLAKFIEDLVRYAAANHDFVILMSHVRTSPNSSEAAAYREVLGRDVRRVIRLIEGAQARGQFVPGDAGVLFYQMVGAAMRIYTAAADAESLIGRSPLNPKVINLHIATCISVFMPSLDRTRSPSAGSGASPLASDKSPTPGSTDIAASAPASLIEQLESLVYGGLLPQLQDIGLTREQMTTLHRIAAEEQPSASTLAHSLEISTQSAKTLAEALTAKGLIRRKQLGRSRGAPTLAVTPKGMATIKRLRRVMDSIEVELLSALGTDEVAVLRGLIAKMLTAKGQRPRRNHLHL